MSAYGDARRRVYVTCLTWQAGAVLIEDGVCAITDERVQIAVVTRALDGASAPHWCNFSFEVDEDAPGGQPDSVLFSVVAARGPSSPLATIASARSGRSPSPPQLGVQHRAGQKAALQLHEAGLELPEHWSWVQDHPRRGLVVDLTVDVSPTQVHAWLLPVMHELNRAPLTGALIYQLYEET